MGPKIIRIQKSPTPPSPKGALFFIAMLANFVKGGTNHPGKRRPPPIWVKPSWIQIYLIWISPSHLIVECIAIQTKCSGKNQTFKLRLNSQLISPASQLVNSIVTVVHHKPTQVWKQLQLCSISGSSSKMVHIYSNLLYCRNIATLKIVL